MFLLLRHSVLTLLFHHLPLFVKVFYLTKHENKEVDKVQQSLQSAVELNKTENKRLNVEFII